MKAIERRKFCGSVFSILGLAGITEFSHKRPYVKDFQPFQKGKTVTLKGGKDAGITHWDIITIGNLSRNRYWGESDEKALHNVICTCSVISGRDFRLIVDPSLADYDSMATELQRRTGLKPDNINAVFITHQHGDHVAGLKHFPEARWFAGSAVASALNSSSRFEKQIDPAGNLLFGAIDVIPTPGHTPDHHSLRFDYKGLSVVIAGDSIATKDFWDERRAYYNVQDEAESRKSMEKIDKIADIIVPGHDNVFFNI
jgi:glyoxylase-like metal-dependent hydrolase (beta-lactamase superfamily II)